MNASRHVVLLLFLTLVLGSCGTRLLAQHQPHPHPQPRPAASQVSVSKGPDGAITTTVKTGKSIFRPCEPAEKCDPWRNPPGPNLLPTIYTDAFDGNGERMENTLPSTPTIFYNLQDGQPVVTTLRSQNLSSFSPQDDLRSFFCAILVNAKFLNGESRPQCRSFELSATPSDAAQAQAAIETAIQGSLDILEGNPRPRSAYNGLPLLHYRAGEKVQKVEPIIVNGKTRGGNVNIHQVWYDSHIESNTAYLDVRAVKDVPWIITYTVDVLNRGHDDFSPFVMYFDDPSLSPKDPNGKPTMPMPHIAMDQTFFDMEDGTRTVFKIKMAPGKYYNLTYTWGWRDHPPRVQVVENACKTIPFNPPPPSADCASTPNTLVWWERSVFFNNGKPDKDYAISKISKYAPEKRMWMYLHDAADALSTARGKSHGDAARQYQKIVALFDLKLDKEGLPGPAQQAWRDWRDRDKLPLGLPKGVKVDKDSDLTMVYLNNTIYAEFSDGGRMDFPNWTQRGTWLKVTLYNGDYFDHGYQNVDFGGARGWENQFKSSVKVAGSGCWFTFGRVHWWMNIPPTAPELKNNPIPGTVTVPAAKRAKTRDGDDTFGKAKVNILYNYEPSRRLRFYQFDPVHHDVAVFSVH